MLGLFCLLLSVGATRLQEESGVLQAENPVVCVENCQVNKDCQYGGWGMWSLCTTSAQCGGAFTTSRTRVISSPAVGLGAPCTQALVQTRNCTEAEKTELTSSQFFQQKCQVPCLVGGWYKTSSCSRTAADCPATRTATASITGMEIWSRNVTQQPQYGGAQCPNLQETRTCEVLCKYDCIWGPWSVDAGLCSSNCMPTDGTVPLQQWSRGVSSLAVNGGKDCTGVSQKYEGDCEIASMLPTCCPGCNVQGWTPWSACQTSQSYNGQPCGAGKMRRQRSIYPPDNFLDTCPESPEDCGVTEQTIDCCRGTCPIDCSCGAWTAWSACASTGSLTCGVGSRTRIRSCSQPKFGGKACGDLTQTQSCSLALCPIPCVMDNWGPWSSCGATCGPRQFQTRTRAMIADAQNGGSPCPESTQTRACDCNPCPVDCQVGPWQLWGPCDQPCGPAKQQRVRDVLVEPKYGGAGCPLLVDTRDCIVNDVGFVVEGSTQVFANMPCDVNCEVGEWSDWSACSLSCLRDDDRTAPGVQTRKRDITVPPAYKGVPCPSLVDQRYCNTQCCPVDCLVSAWTDWSTCTASCGGGFQRRERRITTFARCGGSACEDVAFYEDRRCNIQCCQKACEYYPYGAWSPCLDAQGGEVACGVQGTRFRERAVKTVDPCNPNSCTDTRETKSCSLGSCMTDCVVGPWGVWSNCSVKCGWGMQVRERNLQLPENGGTPCPCYHEYRPCKEKDCCPSCGLTEWGKWEGCSVSCGSGVSHRRRYVNGTNSACETATCEDNLLVDTKECVLDDCPTPCTVSSWSSWSGCDASCGLGVSERTRTIVSQGDGRCPWLEEQQFCNLGECPAPCIYSEWNVWSPCPLTCQPASADKPVQVRRRSPISLGNMNNCPTEIRQEKPCILFPCVVLCEVSQWSSWTICTPAVGWGQKTRTRTVTRVPSSSETCPELLQVGFCFAPPPPSPCEWSTWFEWGEWGASCGPATRQRERVLLSAPTTVVSDNGTAVTYDLEKCSTLGAPFQIQTGNLPKCPIDCVVSKWTDWSACTFPGYRFRTRTIITEPGNGGQLCPACLKEVDECTLRQEEYPPNTCEVQPCLQEV